MHNTLQGHVSKHCCAVIKERLGRGTIQVHDVIEIIQTGRF